MPEGHGGARLPFWNEVLAPAIRAGQRVVVSAHGNSMRALVKYLDGISDADIVGLNIPNGIPLVYELDAQLKPLRSDYLGDPKAAAEAAAAVAGRAGPERSALPGLRPIEALAAAPAGQASALECARAPPVPRWQRRRAHGQCELGLRRELATGPARGIDAHAAQR